MKVAIYTRVSTLRQQQNQTIEQQLERLQAHVNAQGWELAPEHIFRDDGYSGAKLARPGLERLREQAALGEFELILITAPDRLARNYVHQVLLLEELSSRGCQVEFLDRPVSEDPHDQLVLQIRGAVAEYERSLIAERMRRGRQAKLKAGLLLPWTVAPYGYLLDSEQPRDPSRVRVNEVEAAVVYQIFSTYTAPEARPSLYAVAKQLSEAGLPTPTGQPRWNVASVRNILKNPAYTGTAYANRSRPVPARQRKSALLPVGRGQGQRPTPKESWIPIPVPAIISPEMFDQAQSRLALNQQLARRHNTGYDYLLRGLVSCGQCQLSCFGRTCSPDYGYYVCHGRSDPFVPLKLSAVRPAMPQPSNWTSWSGKIWLNSCLTRSKLSRPCNGLKPGRGYPSNSRLGVRPSTKLWLSWSGRKNACWKLTWPKSLNWLNWNANARTSPRNNKPWTGNSAS